MAVLNTTSPARSLGAPKLLPSKTLPSSKARTARFNRLFLLGWGNRYFTVGRVGLYAASPEWSSTVRPIPVALLEAALSPARDPTPTEQQGAGLSANSDVRIWLTTSKSV